MATRTGHIGIVACSAEGAALAYRTICIESSLLLGPHAHPEVSLHGHSLSAYVECLDRDDWDGVADLMLSSAEKLVAVGATVLICPDNTIHAALPRIAARSSVPWIHIAEVVADEAARRAYSRVGLLGTRWLVDGSAYPEKLDARRISYVRPSALERDRMNRIIMDELVRGKVDRASVVFLEGVVSRMKSEGCDAVVLGCTELPIVLSDASSAIPTLDSTRLLARAAMSFAVSM